MTTCFIQLGRYGDIVNILPCVYDHAQRHGAPDFLAHETYADVLDGVSYCNAQLWRGELTDVVGAMRWAATRYDRVVPTQVYGNYPRARKMVSFALDSWRLAERQDDWHNLPLVFDRRDPYREGLLLDQLGVGGGQRIMLTATSGTSSPLPTDIAAFVDRELNELARDHNLRRISLDNLRADRLFDLCGLMEHAALLVSIDTSILHLSYAAKTPTIALVADRPQMWHGTATRKHWLGSVRYGDIQRDWPRVVEMARAVA